VNYWMHNGFVRVDNEKMSKSLGNFFTIREVLKAYDPEVVRLFILRAHYRSPLNYSDSHLDDAKLALTRLYTALRDVPAEPVIASDSPYYQRFSAAMCDDFNTPEALAVLFDLANQVNKSKSAELAATLKGLAGIIGLLQRDAQQFLQAGDQNTSQNAQIEAKIAARAQAKRDKNFALADGIRAELLQQGIILEDSAQGTSWRRA
jgi:cysteinyl-tRNA synthetase